MASLIQGCVCVCMQVLPPEDKFPRLEFSMSSVQLLSRVRLCNPMDHSTPGLPVHHQLLEFTQTHVHRVDDAIQPSRPLSSLSLLPSIFPSIMTTFKLKRHRSYTSNAGRWRRVNHVSCSYHLRVLCYHHFLCRVASIHCKAKHADSSERNPLREIPHFSWLRSSGIPDIELWKQLIVWGGYPFMPYISQQSTNCSLIRHEEAFSLFPNLSLVWGCNLIYSSLVSSPRKGERRLTLRFSSLNCHTAEWTCFCLNKRYK